MPCVEGGRSDCQPEANYIARSQDLIVCTESLSFSHLDFLCNLAPSKMFNNQACAFFTMSIIDDVLV